MTNLSPRQHDTMLFIQRAYARAGYMPTLEEIGAGIGVTSKGRMHTVVASLCALGYLAKNPEKSRGLTILKRVPDDRIEEAARQVCSALGVDPSKIPTARAVIYAALSPEAA